MSRLFRFVAWVPLLALIAVEIYVRRFEGWGAWAAAPLFLLPLILSIGVGGIGILEMREDSSRPMLLLTAVAILPIGWLAVRRFLI